MAKKFKTISIMFMVMFIIAACFTPAAEAKAPRDGKHVIDGYVYIFKDGKPRTGHFKYHGKWYYGHKTESPTYPKGSCTANDMRVEKGNKWYAYGADGAMVTKDRYAKMDYLEKILELDVRKRDHTVRYVYGIELGSIGSRYSTEEMRMQFLDCDGKWYTYEGMQYYPPYVDDQK